MNPAMLIFGAATRLAGIGVGVGLLGVIVGVGVGLLGLSGFCVGVGVGLSGLSGFCVGVAVGLDEPVTITVQLAVYPPSIVRAVIKAVPEAFAVTVPPTTLAIAESVEVHDIF